MTLVILPGKGHKEMQYLCFLAKKKKMQFLLKLTEHLEKDEHGEKVGAKL